MTVPLQIDVTEIAKTIEATTADMTERYLDTDKQFGGEGKCWLVGFLKLHGHGGGKKEVAQPRPPVAGDRGAPPVNCGVRERILEAKCDQVLGARRSLQHAAGGADADFAPELRHRVVGRPGGLEVYEEEAPRKEPNKSGFANRTKHIALCYFFVKDEIEKERLKLSYCPTTEMAADYLTKKLWKQKFEYCMLLIGQSYVISNKGNNTPEAKGSLPESSQHRTATAVTVSETSHSP
ncbi:unnamed protein product, partial [Closterium sp. NIES-53]